MIPVLAHPAAYRSCIAFYIQPAPANDRFPVLGSADRAENANSILCIDVVAS